jgi:uncharacterized protein (UPF0335 family)
MSDRLPLGELIAVRTQRQRAASLGVRQAQIQLDQCEHTHRERAQAHGECRDRAARLLESVEVEAQAGVLSAQQLRAYFDRLERLRSEALRLAALEREAADDIAQAKERWQKQCDAHSFASGRLLAVVELQKQIERQHSLALLIKDEALDAEAVS